jgi:hypothetical protein
MLNCIPSLCCSGTKMADAPSRDETRSSQHIDGSCDRENALYCVQQQESVTQAVVRAVRSESHSDDRPLPPLYSTIDADALNHLFTQPGAQAEEPRQPTGVVKFPYVGYHVRVQSDGTIEVDPPD